MSYRRQGSVIKEWLAETMSYRQQATVLSVLRGCDGKSKHDPSKLLTRYFRGCILYPADENHLDDPHNNFMRPPENLFDATNAFLKDIDAYPVHWLMHFTHGVQLLGYYHPDENVRFYWGGLYGNIIRCLHLTVETKEMNEHRLRDGRRTPLEES